MGKNNQQRRADKKRRAAQQHRRSARPDQSSHHGRPDATPPDGLGSSPADIDRMVLLAADIAFGRRADDGALDVPVATLSQLEADQRIASPPSERLSGLILQLAGKLFEHGWQPADLVHVIRSQWTLRASRLVALVIAEHARSCSAPERAPREWLDQLAVIGAYNPTTRVVTGGQEPSVPVWARREKLDPDQWLVGALQVLGQMARLPKVTPLVDPPSRWPATNKGGSAPTARASAAGVDPKTLATIRALLAKAESTTFEAEADAFSAKAQDMMTRFSIDAAILAASESTTGGSRAGVATRRIHIDGPYVEEKATFLSVVAEANGARAVWSVDLSWSTVVGFPVDLDLTEVLYTSLLVQATRASAAATEHDRRLRSPSFRRAFLVSYAHRIGERLEQTRHDAAAEAEQQYGAGLVLVLADKQGAVDEAYDEMFPDVSSRGSRSYNSFGWYAGRAAADRAHISHGQAIEAAD
jgi:hypothetical protein